MEDFLKSPRFKILAAILVLLFSFMLRAAWAGGLVPLTSKLLGIVLTPAMRVSTAVSNTVGGFFDNILSAGKLAEENEELKKQMRLLNEKLVDFAQYKEENEQLKQYLDLKESNPDFDFETASVIGRDPADRFYSFTIDKGTVNGISLHDPVISPSGLVGMISEAGLTHSKVMTLLDVNMNIGGMDVITRDTGVMSGTVALSEDGLCKFGYLSRDASISAGDIIITTGIGGIFPSDLIVGQVTQVRPEDHGLSLYAVVSPLLDLRTVKSVLVIKSFEGKLAQTAAGQGGD